MARFHGPRIVTSGLVLHLDAANIRSYTGSGTSWIDLTNNGYNGTLTNGPSFNSSNGGSIVFDGSNDYVVVSNPTNLLSKTTYTKIVWFYITSFSTANNLMSGDNNSQHAFWLAVGTKLQAGHNGIWDRVVSNTTLSLNTWYFGATTYSSTSGWALYLNGVLESTNADTTTFNETSASVNLGSYDGANNLLTGRISYASIYDRVLSGVEILQTFNATRGRYGI